MLLSLFFSFNIGMHPLISTAHSFNALIDEVLFAKNCNLIQKFDSKRSELEDKQMYINIILQKVGIESYNIAANGFSLKYYMKQLKRSLAG
jgi:hypothetical protein